MNNYNVEVNTNNQVLSSESKIYKTEGFFYQTRKISGVDSFALMIAESIVPLVKSFIQDYKNSDEVNAFQVDTFDKSFSYHFKLGVQTKNPKLDEGDIVFYSDENNYEKLRRNDQRIVQYIKTHRIFNVIVKPIFETVSESEFKKLYFLSSSEYVNIPMLNKKQQELVEIENENVLVQGVAGSGKTNICLSKIIFTACKNYTGRILYTTFSRALLIDTKSKIEIFKNNIKNLINDYKNNRIIFLDKNHKKAIENRLGIVLIVDNESNIVKKLTQIVEFLETHVDYLLIEDLYKQYYNDDYQMSDESLFTDVFLKQINNHQLKQRLERIKNISWSVIYKEIYGLIFGTAKATDIISLNDYKQMRKNSFTDNECEVIYGIAKIYGEFQKTQNLVDNNTISRKLLKNSNNLKKYTLSIIDEVQDFTEINLNLLKQISVKMFCVGDALQMINPSYFSFSYLKKLMYNEDVTNVAELESNYRNNKKIVEILDELSSINVQEFGTHSFVLSGESIDDGNLTNAVYTKDAEFLNKLKTQKFENFTILVSDQKEKENLRKVFTKQEILTISEIKGLERDTVLLYNILSSNYDKWQKLERFTINHKTADENSVYRYYFNLFYVGVSRAKHNIFIYEDKFISIFNQFFNNNFEILSANDAYSRFTNIIGKLDFDEDEIFDRINEFIKVGQFDNARFYAEKLESDILVKRQLARIDAYQNLVFKGKNREAGIMLWRAGLTKEAKEQFLISGDKNLIDFVDSLQGRTDSELDASIVRFFVDFDENDDAQQLIIDILKQDLETMKEKHNFIKNKLKEFKEKYNGK